MWRIKELLGKDWSPEQIRGALAKENISASTRTIQNIINADTTGKLMKHLGIPTLNADEKA